MESSSSLYSSSLPSLLFHTKYKKRPIRARILASSSSEAHDRHDYYGGGGGHLVDMNMIVLRKRIHEMKIVERNYEPPSHWMDWEKHCFATYDSLICEILGVLQSQLMNTRPCLAFGFFAFIAFSLPFSTAMLLFHFLEMIRHLN